jgi:hypothetical protein
MRRLALSSAMESFIRHVEKRPRYLLIESHGVRNNLLEIVNGTLQFSKVIQEHGMANVLLDYRAVEFRVNQTDAFNIVRYYEQLPSLAAVRIASLINEQTLPLARIWKDVSTKRGFDFNYFLEFDKAEQWLLSADAMK